MSDNAIRISVTTTPLYRDAAKAICELGSLYRIDSGERVADLIGGYRQSVGGLFELAFVSRLSEYVTAIDAKIAEVKQVMEVFREIVQFLLDNPAVQRALAANFFSDSEAHRLITDIDSIGRADESDDVPLSAIGATTESVIPIWWPNDAADGISSAWATEVHIKLQDELAKLTAAKGAVQRAMSRR